MFPTLTVAGFSQTIVVPSIASIWLSLPLVLGSSLAATALASLARVIDLFATLPPLGFIQDTTGVPAIGDSIPSICPSVPIVTGSSLSATASAILSSVMLPSGTIISPVNRVVPICAADSVSCTFIESIALPSALESRYNSKFPSAVSPTRCKDVITSL